MSYKRITKYRSINALRTRRTYEKVFFIEKFLSTMSDSTQVVIVIDEAGFGTSPFKKYGIAPVGEPATRLI